MDIKLLAIAVALVPMAAAAADPAKTDARSPGLNVSFDTLDSNKDGRISLPEASADPRLVESFSSADRNGDGYLDNEEFDSNRKRGPAQP